MKKRIGIAQNGLEIVASVDAHTENYYLYCVEITTGEILADCNLPGDPKALLKHLKKVGAGSSNTIIIYEAGSVGYSPYRIFTKAGYKCKVIAPTSIPKRGKGSKTDRTDAINNLQYYYSDLLSYVHVPSAQEEDDRELVRFRFDLSHQISKQKQKILSLVKRTGFVYTETKSNWTRRHYQWLRTVELPPSSRRAMNFMLENLDNLECQMGKLEKEIDIVVNENPKYKAMVSLLEVVAGFGRVNATTTVIEIQDFKRFPAPAALMSYIGLIPGKHASGQSDPSLSITKAGNRFLRLTLVGAAKSYRDRRLLNSTKTINDLPEPLKDFVKRMQDRLHGRYRHFCKNKKPGNKARCAVARELCAFVWELFVKIAPEISEYQIRSQAA